MWRTQHANTPRDTRVMMMELCLCRHRGDRECNWFIMKGHRASVWVALTAPSSDQGGCWGPWYQINTTWTPAGPADSPLVRSGSERRPRPSSCPCSGSSSCLDPESPSCPLRWDPESPSCPLRWNHWAPDPRLDSFRCCRHFLPGPQLPRSPGMIQNRDFNPGTLR